MATTFADIVGVNPLSSHSYAVDLQDDWCIGTVPNGGYITSIFLLVARRHMQITHAKRSEPHPMNLHLEFLRRTSATSSVFTVKDVKLGSRISNLHLTLSQQESGKWQDEVEGYITMSNLSSETGISLPTNYQLYPPALPVDLPTLASNGRDTNYALRTAEPFPKFRRAGRHIQLHLLRPERRPSDRPKSILDQWVRFAPDRKPGKWTNDALGYVVDMFPQIIESYVNAHVEDASNSNEKVREEVKAKEPIARFWYPTLLLNLDVKKLLPVEGVDWLFVRVQAKAIDNGRFDLNVEVRDANSELVALSTHASLAVDAARNIGKRGGAKKDSKI